MTPHDDRQSGSVHSSVVRLLEDELSEEEFVILAQRLRKDPEARKEYFDCISLETNLDHVYAQPLRRGGTDSAGRTAAVRKQAVRALGIAAAAAMVVAAVMWFIQTRQPDPGAIALKLCGNSEWTMEGAADPRGITLPPGATLHLERGVVELSFPDEVRAVVEAPATMVLVDDQTLRLDRGRGFFEVASVEGRGFTVVTQRQRIVDLGTAFGVDAKTGRDGMELHVFEGRVRIDSLDGGEGEVVEAGRSVLLDGARVERDLDEPSTGFLRDLPLKVETVFVEDFESGLAPEKDYAVLVEPLAIRDLDDNRFSGIEDNKTWNFSTGHPYAVTVPVRNPGFEEDGNTGNRGAAIAHWHPQAPGWGWGLDEQRGSLVPTEGQFFGRVFGGYVLRQDLEETIVAGRTYVLTVDVGLASSGATFGLFGSDAGPDMPLAEAIVSRESESWLRDQTVTYTATAADATGQKLGIVLKRSAGEWAAFDRVRLASSGYTNGNELPGNFGMVPVAPPLQRDPDATKNQEADHGESSPLVLVQLHPSDDAAFVTPGGNLTMAFNKPIKLGRGRIFLRNITDWSVTEIPVGGPRTLADGRFLTIIPPAGLPDGDRSMGRIGGWECDAWAGTFNPGGDGTWYRHGGLRDTTQGRGLIGSMRGPIMATFGQTGPGSWIRREIGEIVPSNRYTVAVAIGVRNDSAEPASRFDGYTIRLRSGAKELAKLSEDTPPGPPNSVTVVSFSWDSAQLPQGVSPGDPLALEIAPNQASGSEPGYLDFDHVRVTVVGE